MSPFFSTLSQITWVAQPASFVFPRCRPTISAAIVGERPAVQRRARLPKMMQSLVFRLCHQLQILNAVIRRIIIDVVNDFVTSETPAKVCFHHQPVFHYLPAIRKCQSNVSGSCPIPAPSALPLRVARTSLGLSKTRSGAKLRSFDTVWGYFKRATTLLARHLNTLAFRRCWNRLLPYEGPIAVDRTKLLTLLRGLPGVGLATLLASAFSLTVNSRMVAGSRAIPGSAGPVRRNREYLMTLFAGKIDGHRALQSSGVVPTGVPAPRRLLHASILPCISQNNRAFNAPGMFLGAVSHIRKETQ